MRGALPFISIALIATMAACSGQEPVDNEANGAGLPAPTTAMPSDPGGRQPTSTDAAANSAATIPDGGAAAIPAALHGRWGLTLADCTSTRGDAKGLLVIGPTELRFYESRAAPAAGVEAQGDRISGQFNFIGEGQRWTKFQALRVDGNTLVRTETNPATSFAYVKC